MLSQALEAAWEAGRGAASPSWPYTPGVARRPASVEPELSRSRLLQSTDEQWRTLSGAAWGSPGSLPTMVGVPTPLMDGGDEEGAASVQVRGPEAGTSDRYQDLGPIGKGGMGEVRRVRDRDLLRVLAMKVVRQEVMHSPVLASRFIQEAQIIAQLNHPGIVPAYELGRLPDGRLYFTMKEVHGRTLGDVIREVHAASRSGRWRPSLSGWTLWKLIDAFLTVCEAVAYAHARAVVHRDLKPANVMVGEYGEVLVMDWGLAKVLHDDRELDDEVGMGRPAIDEAAESLVGAITGTPNYMSPEQARGERHRLGPRTDVYALGATLYEILMGRPPYEARTSDAVLAAVVEGAPLPPRRLVQASARGLVDAGTQGGGAPVPEDLWEICRRAMSREPEDRYADASDLAREIGGWLQGAKERERALALVSRAEALLPEIAALRSRADWLRVSARRALEPIRPFAPVEEKRPGWALQDEALRLDREADLREIDYLQLLHGALLAVPDLPEAHDRLADHYRQRHADAELRRDAAAAARLEATLRAHDTGRHTAWLAGLGAVSISTDPPGADVDLYHYEERDRRLVAVFQRSLGKTPLVEVPLAAGSYVLVLKQRGHEEVRYPVRIGRQQTWDATPQSGAGPVPVRMPRKGELSPGDVYVPAGCFWSGGDPECLSAPLSRVWVPGFVVRSFPVTNREYLGFLDDLVVQGREEEALRCVPRERAGTLEEPGAMLYGRTDDGRFALRQDADGDAWEPDWPVVHIDWHSANAYADHVAAARGQPWRLPRELEWEKAARGVDGRFFPWGDFLDPTWCRMRDSTGGRALPTVVDSYPVDQSPYGARGLAGNTRDWCLDGFRQEGPEIRDGCAVIDPEHERASGAELRAYRGGGWNNPAHICRAAYRSGYRPYFRYPILGARLVRSYEP